MIFVHDFSSFTHVGYLDEEDVRSEERRGRLRLREKENLIANFLPYTGSKGARLEHMIRYRREFIECTKYAAEERRHLMW